MMYLRVNLYAEKKVPDVTLKYLSNNLPKGVKYVLDEHGNLTITFVGWICGNIWRF